MTERAVFLDRDGTLVHPRHYPSHPRDLVLFEGIGPELHSLQAGGFRLVLITNQAGIARGLFSEQNLALMHEHLRRELLQLSVHLDGIYYCPHHVDGVVPGFAVRCSCRKPKPGMLFRAAADLGLDLGGSWFVGDILDDVEAGNRAGARTVLVDLGSEPPPPTPYRRPDFVARNTVHALRIIRSAEAMGPSVERGYIPDRWLPSVGPARTL